MRASFDGNLDTTRQCFQLCLRHLAQAKQCDGTLGTPRLVYSEMVLFAKVA